MAEPIISGNAFEDGREFEQWFVGDLQAWTEAKDLPFDPQITGLRSTREVEIKLGKHPAGEERPDGWTRPAGINHAAGENHPGGETHPSEQVTLSLLVRGEFLLRFRPAGHSGPEHEYHLREVGDYLIWRQTVSHTWTSLQDSVILTVRWQDSP